MCEIGKPIEIVDVEPLVLPAPLCMEKEQPTGSFAPGYGYRNGGIEWKSVQVLPGGT